MSDERRRPRALPLAVLAAIVAGLLFMALLYSLGTHRDLERTLGFGHEAMAFLENTCKKFDSYNQGRKTDATYEVDAAVGSFATFLAPENVEADDTFIEEYVQTQHLSGLLVTDADGRMVAHYDVDGRDPLMLWREELACSSVKAIYQGSKISYSSVLERRGVDFAVSATAYGEGVAFAYRSLATDTDDGYSYNIADVLVNNTFHQDPIVLIMQGKEIVSSNDPDADSTLAHLLSDNTLDWKDEGLTRVEYRKQMWYAVRAVYKDYGLYALYPKSEVMTSRGAFVVAGALACLTVWVVILVARGISDRRNLAEKDKQLGIINAISSTYDSAFLFQLKTQKIEGIRMSALTAKLFADHPDTYDFLDNVCREAVSPDCRETVMALLDVTTLQERMEDAPYLEAEIRDYQGVWYSMQVIPQCRDEQGNLESVVIATRNISKAKRAEELSFQDKLTGLRNRNYLESRGDDLVNEGLPVSIIMMDCNHLKRTNDALGHEMGDELLRRTASVLSDTAGDTCLPMRVGGDEFLMVCPGTDRKTALAIVNSLRASLVKASDEVLTVSASFGVATVETAGATLADVYRLADGEMYREKRSVHAGDADR